MKTYLVTLGFDIWESMMAGYTTPITPPIDASTKNLSENNAKVMNSILCNLLESEFVKVMHCVLSKDIWENIQNIYEGDDKG